jgi:hypothetical protein
MNIPYSTEHMQDRFFIYYISNIKNELSVQYNKISLLIIVQTGSTPAHPPI